MTDKEKILSEIDGFWQSLLVLADLSEESGDEVLARGLRYLAQNKKLPRNCGSAWNWTYSYKQDGYSNWIPRQAWARLPKGRWRREFSTALLAGAQGVGQAIVDGAIKEESFLET